MQAGLVSTRLSWSDIFKASLSLRILVAVVRFPVTVHETGTAELPTFSWPHEQRTAT